MPAETRSIEYRPLSSIEAAPRNVKDHDIGELSKSIARFGFNDAVIVDGRTGKLVSGHGRVEALRAMFVANPTAVPDGVQRRAAINTNLRNEPFDWMVPVQTGWSSKDDTEAEAFLVAANRLVELGGWTPALEQVLIELASKNALEGIGYDRDDVDRIINEANARREGATDVDDVPQVADAGGVKLGDLFRLGEHLLLCGSSIDAADVDRVTLGEALDAMWTDPPSSTSARCSRTSPCEVGSQSTSCGGTTPKNAWCWTSHRTSSSS
jgi:hypothetical protein